MVPQIIRLILVCSLVVACSSAPVSTGPEPAPVTRDPRPTEPVDPKPLPENAALDALLDDARAARQASNMQRAEDLLRRAQRIEPQSSRVYLEFAYLYRDRGDVAQSQRMAERGLLYCDGGECSSLRQLSGK